MLVPLVAPSMRKLPCSASVHTLAATEDAVQMYVFSGSYECDECVRGECRVRRCAELTSWLAYDLESPVTLPIL